MAFDCARAPGQRQSGGDGVDVAVDAGGESVEAGQVVLPDGVEPSRETLALAVGEHGREGPDMPGGLVAALVAERHDLLPQLPRVGDALVPAVVQVGLVVIEYRGPVLPLAGEQVLRLRGVGEPLDGVPGHAELPLDRTEAVS